MPITFTLGRTKKDILFWRGGRADSLKHRTQIVQQSDKFSFIDAKFVNSKKDQVLPELHLKYKYQISLDGTRATWERMVWQMFSNTLLIKPKSSQIQWFHRGLIPGYHYIEINDLSTESLTNLKLWLDTNNNLNTIIKNSNSFANEYLNTEDLLSYIIILLNEYSKNIN